MKLTAFRDRRHDPDKDLVRLHALDVFRIVAMLTQPEYDQILGNLRRFANNPQVLSCAELVRIDFANATARGVLAMREHPLWQNDPQLDTFLGAVAEMLTALPAPPQAGER